MLLHLEESCYQLAFGMPPMSCVVGAQLWSNSNFLRKSDVVFNILFTSSSTITLVLITSFLTVFLSIQSFYLKQLQWLNFAGCSSLHHSWLSVEKIWLFMSFLVVHPSLGNQRNKPLFLYHLPKLSIIRCGHSGWGNLDESSPSWFGSSSNSPHFCSN